MNIQQIMQQAKTMQDKMAQMQEKAAEAEVTGTAGGGMVNVTMTCKGNVVNVSINSEVMDPNDPTMTEDLVKAAVNDARRKADETLADETKRLMEEMGLPSDFQLPF